MGGPIKGGSETVSAISALTSTILICVILILLL
jgi:hypothetical protein